MSLTSVSVVCAGQRIGGAVSARGAVELLRLFCELPKRFGVVVCVAAFQPQVARDGFGGG